MAMTPVQLNRIAKFIARKESSSMIFHTERGPIIALSWQWLNEPSPQGQLDSLIIVRDDRSEYYLPVDNIVCVTRPLEPVLPYDKQGKFVPGERPLPPPAKLKRKVKRK